MAWESNVLTNLMNGLSDELQKCLGERYSIVYYGSYLLVKRAIGRDLIAFVLFEDNKIICREAPSHASNTNAQPPIVNSWLLADPAFDVKLISEFIVEIAEGV